MERNTKNGSGNSSGDCFFIIETRHFLTLPEQWETWQKSETWFSIYLPTYCTWTLQQEWNLWILLGSVIEETTHWVCKSQTGRKPELTWKLLLATTIISGYRIPFRNSHRSPPWTLPTREEISTDVSLFVHLFILTEKAYFFFL